MKGLPLTTVAPPGNRSRPPAPATVRGITLRSALVLALMDARKPRSVAELGIDLRRRGFVTGGRVGKDISDALRWEMARGRVRRIRRGTYMVGVVPPTTAWRMRQRVAAHTHNRITIVAERRNRREP